MMRKTKVLAAWMLMASLVLGMFPPSFLGMAHVEAAASDTKSGTVTSTWSGTVDWEYADGTLTLSGGGQINADTATSSGGWSSYKNSITRLVVNDISGIGSQAFQGYNRLTTLEAGEQGFRRLRCRRSCSLLAGVHFQAVSCRRFPFLPV